MADGKLWFLRLVEEIQRRHDQQDPAGRAPPARPVRPPKPSRRRRRGAAPRGQGGAAQRSIVYDRGFVRLQWR
jgi:hypothetical protein